MMIGRMRVDWLRSFWMQKDDQSVARIGQISCLARLIENEVPPNGQQVRPTTATCCAVYFALRSLTSVQRQ